MSSNNITKVNYFELIWDRVKKETDIKNLVELAKATETSQPNISKRKKENRFPVEWAYTIGKKYGLLTEWIMTGEGPKRLNEVEQDKQEQKEQTRENERRFNNKRITDLLSPNLREALEALQELEKKHPSSFFILFGKILEELRNQETIVEEDNEKKKYQNL